MIHLMNVTKEGEWDAFKPYTENPQYNPLWDWYRTEGIRGGHGGMDYLVLRAFIESIQQDKEPPINAYDAAAWMAMTALSEQSIAAGGAVQTFPDFTNGRWLTKREHGTGRYDL